MLALTRSLILIVGLTFHPACSLTLSSPHTPASVQLLRIGKGICTAFSVGSGSWMTAAHCAEGILIVREHGLVATMSGHRVEVEYVDPDYDFAVLSSSLKAPALRFASKAPQVDDPISVEGHPYGVPSVVRMTGTIAARMVPFNGIPSDILDVTIGGGNSGSPVLNVAGEVVGVIWGRFEESEHALSVPWEMLGRRERTE